MQDYDVIIIGAGPAGSTAGYLLSSFGFKTLIIDKSRFPRKKLCAGCITYKTIKLLQRVYGESVAVLKEKGIMEFESAQYEISFKGKVLLRRSCYQPFYFVDRTSYDEYLLRKAQLVGAEVVEGEGVVSYDVLMNEIRTSSGRRLRARFIIGADGANSLIRRTFSTGPFNQRTWDRNMATALEVFVDRSDVREDIDHPIILFGFIEYGYSWVFPNRDRLLVGSCGLNRMNRKRFMDSFNNLLSFMNLRGLNGIKIESHPLPCGVFLEKPLFGNTLLIGDAAGFTDPLLGEGIFYAQRSAELASHAIYRALKNGESLERVYLQSLQESIYPDFIYALRLRQLVFKYLNRFHFIPLKILLKAFGDIPVEVVHGIRTYKWFRRRYL